MYNTSFEEWFNRTLNDLVCHELMSDEFFSPPASPSRLPSKPRKGKRPAPPVLGSDEEFNIPTPKKAKTVVEPPASVQPEVDPFETMDVDNKENIIPVCYIDKSPGLHWPYKKYAYYCAVYSYLRRSLHDFPSVATRTSLQSYEKILVQNGITPAAWIASIEALAIDVENSSQQNELQNSSSCESSFQSCLQEESFSTVFTRSARNARSWLVSTNRKIPSSGTVRTTQHFMSWYLNEVRPMLEKRLGSLQVRLRRSSAVGLPVSL